MLHLFLVLGFRYSVLGMLTLFVFSNLCAQSPIFNNQSSIVNFPADLDSAIVDSFYQTKTIDLRKCDNPELYFEVYRWLNTKYRYGGNSDNGIDCSHFANMLYQKVYSDTLNSSSASIYTQCKPVKGGMDEAAEGDLVFFCIKKKRISHVGVYLQHGKFAHASTQSGVIISDMSEPYYKRHFYKVARIE